MIGDWTLDFRRSLRAWAAVGPGLALFQAVLAVDCLADEKSMYVIASDPFPNSIFVTSPTILYRVGNERLEKVRTITTRRQDTTFVHSYPEQGFVFVGSVGARPGSFLMDVVDLRSPSVERTVDLDGCWGCNAQNYRSSCMGCLYATSHLLDRAGRLIYMIRSGTWYSEQLDCKCRDLGVDVLTGETIADLGSGALRHAYVNGVPGGLVDGGEFGTGIIADGIRAVAQGKDDAKGIDLGWDLPRSLVFGRERWNGSARLIVDNDDMRVLAPMPFAPEDQLDEGLFFVFHHESREWSEIKLPGSGVPMAALRSHVHTLDMTGQYFPMRAFREWLAAEEIYAHEWGPRGFERLAEQRIGPFRFAEERFRDHQAALPGKFRLYNARTKILIMHDTGEPDTEVLYVDEDDRVYYRVSDELFRARIEDGALGTSEVLVRAPEVGSVHWLFFGNE